MKNSLRKTGLLAALLACSTTAGAEGLLGSPASMVHQHAVAVAEKYAFLRTPLDVARLAKDGELVEVTGDADLIMAGVSFPYARPEVRAFVRRFARDYHDSTGVAVTITSLTRPVALQPKNAHKLSVHPAGMAVDFRVPKTSAERAYLERSLLAMERSGLLDVTREKTPAHYHVAVFAAPMLQYLAGRDASDPIVARTTSTPVVTPAPAPRAMAAVSGRTTVDSLNESRLPLFALAMALLFGMGVTMLHAPRAARQSR